MTYLFTLQPQWCGSRAEMAAFAEKERGKGRNSRLRFLPGYVATYDAALKRRDGDFAAAVALCDQALTLGEHWEFLQERAAAKAALRDFPGALADLDRAVELRPQVGPLLRARAALAESMEQWQKAGMDLLTALRLDPVTTSTVGIPAIVSGLRNEHDRLLRIGRDDGADEVLRTSAALDPQGTVTDTGRTEPARIPPPANLDTGNRSACLLAEATLLREKKWDEIVSVWSAYIDQHPDDGDAYARRATYREWMGDDENARSDHRKACDLGIQRECVSVGGAR